ncbi:hypothetical protein VISI1226_08644 [Vibrio sinaloensis DSM 21326]|uniref:Uncharacterized protein n=1 Tax=Vibrio sinaloensis DSM 21326 TaxID=945550 RepID=E8MDJ4_PHOS4|nr:hypothetical protein [Vibrio sinaloensis]EGA67980.1 hypothetical protein VISI1226_08644 [Vibrio sinaloensis DSM 21326]
MYKEADFSLQGESFRFKKDEYPLKRINNIRVKRLSWMDNLGQIAFWVCLFSGAVWLAVIEFPVVPTFLQVLCASLTMFGFVFAILRCSRYALQVEFRHVDETGLQWVNVAKSYSHQDGELFAKQVDEFRQLLSR